MDGFDHLPDSLLLQIFNSVSDAKTLTRCRSISKRFNSLVSQTEYLFLNVDRVISPDSNSNSPLFFLLINFLFKRKSSQSQTEPAQILAFFPDVRHLTIQLPPGDDDMPLLYNEQNCNDFLNCLPTRWQEHPSVFEKSRPTVKWVAEFGESMKSCVVFGFSYITDLDDEDRRQTCHDDFERGLKERVLWTISSLMAASIRHCMLKEVVKKSNKNLERLILKDKESKGKIIMDRKGLKECRETAATAVADGCDGWLAVMKDGGVRMRIRKLNMVRRGGRWVVGPTLVVVRPTNDDVDGDDDAELALKTFGEEREVVEALLKSRRYELEMKSL